MKNARTYIQNFVPMCLDHSRSTGHSRKMKKIVWRPSSWKTNFVQASQSGLLNGKFVQIGQSGLKKMQSYHLLYYLEEYKLIPLETCINPPHSITIWVMVCFFFGELSNEVGGNINELHNIYYLVPLIYQALTYYGLYCQWSCSISPKIYLGLYTTKNLTMKLLSYRTKEQYQLVYWSKLLVTLTWN